MPAASMIAHPPAIDQRRTACDRCRGFKLKCERSDEDPSRCKRCMRSKKVCIVSAEHRIGQSASKPLPQANADRFVFAEQYTTDGNAGLSTMKDTTTATEPWSSLSSSLEPSPSSSTEGNIFDPSDTSMDSLFAHPFNDVLLSEQSLMNQDFDNLFTSFVDQPVVSCLPPAKRVDHLRHARAEAYDTLTKLQADTYDLLSTLHQRKTEGPLQGAAQSGERIPIKEAVALMKRFVEVLTKIKESQAEAPSAQLELAQFAFNPNNCSLDQFKETPPATAQSPGPRRTLLDMPAKLSLLSCLIYLSRLHRVIFTRTFTLVLQARSAADLAHLDMPKIGFGEFNVTNMPILQLNIFLEVCIQSWNKATQLIGFTCHDNVMRGDVPDSILGEDDSSELITSVLTQEIATQEAEYGSPGLKDLLRQLPSLLQKLSNSQLSLAQSMLEGRSCI